MSGGLVALLDDIATLAKVTASSIDDVAANAVKASSKAVGVVIDDTAVTPQYVSGLSPERELPIIAKIARGSLINKLFIILPIALLLTWLAPQVLPFLLVVGGAYLCFEGGEKVLEKLGWLPGHHEDHEERGAASAEELEKSIVSSATRTDLILSAEIMLVSMANLSNEHGVMRVAVLIAVAFFMTFFVYGLVALLVKADDFGARLARGALTPLRRHPCRSPGLGVPRGSVRVAPPRLLGQRCHPGGSMPLPIGPHSPVGPARCSQHSARGAPRERSAWACVRALSLDYSRAWGVAALVLSEAEPALSDRAPAPVLLPPPSMNVVAACSMLTSASSSLPSM